MLKVLMDSYILLAIPTLQEQLMNVGNAVMHGIPSVFPPDADKENDRISLKKLRKLEVRMWLTQNKRDTLLLILKGWLYASRRINAGIPLAECESVFAKL